MAVGQGEDWEERVRAIAGALLTLEVNTIEKPNMSAEKMPELPLALHGIVADYASYLAERGFPVSDGLLAAASARLVGQSREPAEAALAAWPKQGDVTSGSLTNGAETFDALQWAAHCALTQPGAPRSVCFSPAELAVLDRIRANSRQLREVALRLAQTFVRPPPLPPLFGATVGTVTAGLLAEPRPVLRVPTDIVLMVRKAWDIGTESVLFQTVMQVDGDVVLRVAPQPETDKRAFFAELHRGSVELGVRQWRALFDLARALLGDIGKALFGAGRV